MNRILREVIAVSIAVSLCFPGLAEQSPQSAILAPCPTLAEQMKRLKEMGIPTTIEELQLPRIPEQENGAVLYRQAFEILKSVSKKYEQDWQYLPYEGKAKWKDVPAENRKKVTDLILNDPDLARAYQLVEKASQMKCWFYGEQELRKGFDESSGTEHLANLRRCVRMLVARATIEAERNEIDTALGTLLTGFSVSHSLCNEPAALPSLVRVALDLICLSSLEDTLNKGTGNVQLCHALMAKVRGKREGHLTLEALQGEMVLFGIPWFSRAREAGIKTSEEEIDKWSDAERRAGVQGADVRELLNGLREKGPDKFWSEEELIYLEGMARITLLAKKEFWETRDDRSKLEDEFRRAGVRAGIFAGDSLGVMLRNAGAEARLDARLGEAELALALRIYKAKKGSYPTALTELVPEILPALPKDPFTGKNFFYNPRGMTILIYSVGENLKDDLGHFDEEKGGYREKDHDIVWKLSYF